MGRAEIILRYGDDIYTFG